MENKRDTDFLSDPERFLAIANTEQLVDEFGDMFEETKLNNLPVFLEKKTYSKDLPEERFFATQADRVSSLATLRGEGVWDIDKEDQEFLETVHKALVAIKIAVEGHGTKFDKDIIIHGKTINVKYEPYTPETSEYILGELNERKKLLQKDN